MEQSVRNVIGMIDFINKQNGTHFKFFLRMPKDIRILWNNSMIVERSQLVGFFQLAIVPFCLQISIFNDAFSVTRWIEMNCLKLIIISLWSKVKNVQCMILLSIVYYHMTANIPGEVLEAEVPYIANRSFYLCIFQFTIFVHCNIYKPDPHWLSLLYPSNLHSVFEHDLKLFCEWVLPYFRCWLWRLPVVVLITFLWSPCFCEFVFT